MAAVAQIRKFGREFRAKRGSKYNKEERAQGQKNVGFQQTGLYQDTLEPCQRAKMRSLGWS
jgi:hypothetical protein